MASTSAGLALYGAVAVPARMAGAGLPSALLLGVIAASGSVSEASLLIATATGVAAVMGPVSGACVDRVEHPKRAYLAALATVCIASALLAVGIGRWPTPVLVIVCVAAGLGFPFFLGALSAQLRRIAPEADPARAYSVDVGTYNVAEIAGPAIVGVAYIVDAAMPGAASLEVVTLLYVVALGVLLFVPVPARSVTHAAPPQSWMQSLGALSVMWTSPSLRRTTVISVIAHVAIACYVVSMPLLAQDLAGDPGFGPLVLAITACGALVGSVLLARRPIRRRGPGTLVASLTLALGVILAAMSVVPVFVLVIPLAFLFGLSEAPQLSSVLQVRDRESPVSSRALVFATGSSLKVGAFAVGSLLAGALAAEGWRTILLVAALVEVIAVAAGLLVAPPRRTRELPGNIVDRQPTAPSE